MVVQYDYKRCSGMKPFFTAPVWTGAAAVGATHGGAVVRRSAARICIRY